MTCTPLGNGGWMCTHGGSRARCSSCQRPATLLCDYQLGGAKAGSTCDRKLCAGCAVKIGPGIDYCPPHGRAGPSPPGARTSTGASLVVRAPSTLATRKP